LVDANKFVLSLENAQLINHIVVFLTGTVPFQAEYGASVHLHWPSLEGNVWQLLGMLSNEKPSAIFKLHRPTAQTTVSAIHAEIGISIEPIAMIETQMTTMGKSLVLRNPQSISQELQQMSKNMLIHFYNYASSFAIRAKEDDPSSVYIPVKVLEEWYQLTERRLQADPKWFNSSTNSF
jgi:protein Hikeshi